MGLRSHRIISEGRGPLEQDNIGLGNVESHKCIWVARKSHLGVSRKSYGPGYSPQVDRKCLAQARRVQMFMVTVGWMVTCTPHCYWTSGWVTSASRSLLGLASQYSRALGDSSKLWWFDHNTRSCVSWVELAQV